MDTEGTTVRRTGRGLGRGLSHEVPSLSLSQQEAGADLEEKAVCLGLGGSPLSSEDKV